MTFIWLMGGFGNNLFQILSYNILKVNSNHELMFVQTLTKKNFFTKTLSWSIHENLYGSVIPEDKLMDFGVLKTTYILILAGLSKRRKRNVLGVNFFTNNGLEGRHLFGYYQDKTFLHSHASHINILGEQLRMSLMLPENYDIVVHYRKGDSEWAQKFTSYYFSVRKKLLEEIKKVVIITDSPNEALDFFTGLRNIEINRSTSDILDFSILLSAKKLYCAPSTFSWWAAHSTSNETKVIAPSFFESTLGMYIDHNRLEYI